MRGSMTVIGNGLNVAVDVRIEVLPSLSLVNAARDHMKQMRNHAGGDEQLSLRIVINAPRIAEAMRDDLEYLLCRVVAPHAAIDLDAVARDQIVRERLAAIDQASRANRFSDLRRSRVALKPIQPAVGSPVQAVDDLVTIANAPAGQPHLDVGDICFVVTIAIGDEQQIRRSGDEHAVEPDGKRGWKDDAVHEDLAAVGDAVVVGILENDDSAVAGARESLAP